FELCSRRTQRGFRATPRAVCRRPRRLSMAAGSSPVDLASQAIWRFEPGSPCCGEALLIHGRRLAREASLAILWKHMCRGSLQGRREAFLPGGALGSVGAAEDDVPLVGAVAFGLKFKVTSGEG